MNMLLRWGAAAGLLAVLAGLALARLQVDAAVTLAFYSNGQNLGNELTQRAALGDLDGDFDLDLFTAAAGTGAPNRIWLNQAGTFTSNGQILTGTDSQDVALGDLDRDGDLDAFLAVGGTTPANEIWLNNGLGFFSDSGQRLGSQVSRGVALGDIDGDLDLDAVVANNGANQVFVRTTGAVMTSTGQLLGGRNSYGVALGDLDGDRDLDAFFANGQTSNQADTVWLNDGGGVFTDTGQTLGLEWSVAVALGDLDGDRDLDAVTASWYPGGGSVWLNDGAAGFTASGQKLGSTAVTDVALGDLDGDGDLDAVFGTAFPAGSEVWLNQGNGVFSLSSLVLEANKQTNGIDLGDLDGDFDLDLFISNTGPDAVLLNGLAGLPNARIEVEREGNAEGRPSAFWTAAGPAKLPLRLNTPAGQPVEVHTRIEGPSGTVTQTIPFASGEQVKTLTVANPAPMPNQTVTLTVQVGFPTTPPASLNQTDVLALVFVDGEQGIETCVLCYMEWLLRFFGFNPTFGALHQIDLGARKNTPQWRYYTQQMDYYSPELANLVATHPMILIDGYDVLESWTPALVTLNSGGDGLISQAMVDDLIGLAERIQNEADLGLSQFVAHELEALEPQDFVGLTVAEGWDDLVLKRPISETYFPTIFR